MSTKNLIISGVVLGLSIIVLLIVFPMKWSYQNKNVKAKNQIVGQQKSNEANFDKMKKSIAQVAEVAQVKMDMSTKAFKEIYPALMEGRYSKGDGSLMKWITESNPQFDLAAATSLYDKLAVVIEANRQEFFEEQKKLIAYNQAQHDLINTVPGSWFLNSNDTIAIVIVTSVDTKQAFSTGEENDTNVFKN